MALTPDPVVGLADDLEEVRPMATPGSAHPADETLRAYGLGQLADADAESVEAHLEGCDDCRGRAATVPSDSFLGRIRNLHHPDAALTTSLEEGSRAGVRGIPPELRDHPQYELIRELGRGGMGVVYLAKHRLMDRLEVLKVLNPEMLGRRGTLDRFLREIRSAARLGHPNVVGAHAALRVGRLVVLAMEYVPGHDLARLVRARGPLPIPLACDLIRQAALGLQHAHERGMVHRDIKPGNLILTRQVGRPVVKLVDFGLAKATSEDRLDGALTYEGQMLGSPDFMAPEQIIDAQKADIRADIYSLGCTLYYLLAGAPPFRGASLYDLLQAHHSMDAVPLDRMRSDVPAELAALVGKMMAKDAADRFQTPGEVARALLPFGVRVGGDSEPRQAGAGALPREPSAEPDVKAALDFLKHEPPQWDSLLGYLPASGNAGGRSPGRRGPIVGALALLGLGLGIVCAVVVIKIRTRDAVIVLRDVPKGAEVRIDGRKVRIRGREAETAIRAQARPGVDDVPAQTAGAPAETSPRASSPPAAPEPARFRVIRGNWTVEGGEFVQSSLASGRERPLLVLGEDDWTEYDLTLEAKRDGGIEGFVVGFHWQGPGDYRDFGVGRYGNTGHDLCVVDGGTWGRAPENFRWGTIETGRWYALRVEARGPLIRCFLDGRQLFEQSDSRLTRGRVSLATWGTAVRYRRVKVTDLRGNVVWQGPAVSR